MNGKPDFFFVKVIFRFVRKLQIVLIQRPGNCNPSALMQIGRTDFNTTKNSDFLEIIKKLLKKGPYLRFLPESSENDLKTMVACIRVRID
jgi:hypothetical protein